MAKLPTRKDEMTKLGLYGLAPFAIGAVGVWIAPQRFGFDLHKITLIYAVVISSYFAGIGAGGLLTTNPNANKDHEPLLPGMAAVLTVWGALCFGFGFLFYVGAFWTYLLVIGVMVYLLLRDLRAVDAGQLPSWYGPLRIRLTFWASMALSLIAVRVYLWGLY